MALSRGCSTPSVVSASGRTRQPVLRPFVAHGKQWASNKRAALLIQNSTAQPTYTTTNGTAAYPALAPLNGQYEEVHAFSDFANWLVPDKLLVGRYPYVEPSRCKSYEDGEKKLQQILKAGVTTFISLQAEVPAQEDMRLAGVAGFMPYKSAAELIKHSMVGPPPAELMNGLRTPELDKFLPPRHKPATEAYDSYNDREKLSFAHNPIEDLSVPNAQQLRDIVADLQQRVAAGEVPYVHCWGGRGRVGLVGACFLAATYGLSADEALERVQRAFDTRKDDQRRSPETDQQHQMVRDFVAALKA